MKTKSKTFARKLTALFLAAILAISCFMGTVTAFAKSTDDYHDSRLAYNFMTWAEAADNQTCEALLDWADLYMGDLLSGLLGSDHLYFSQNVVVTTITIDAYFDSIDGVIDLLRQADGLLDSYGGLIGGDVKNLDLGALPALPSVTQGDGVVSKCGRSYRAVNDAKTIVMALAKTLYVNSNDNNGNKNVLGQFVKGKLSLGGILEGVLGGSVFGLLQDTLNMWDGYETNLVYNLVANVIFDNTLWYTDAEADSYRAYLKNNKNGTKWNYDEQLLDKLSTELLQQININVTYDIEKNTDETLIEDDGDVQSLKATDNSQLHYKNIKAEMKKGKTFRQASIDLGYDPNLHYTDEGNVYLFQYGYQADGETATDVFAIDKNTTTIEAVFAALEIAWKTVLKDTMNLIHVNYSNWENEQKGLSTNFDNAFYYWLAEQNLWNKNDWAANYSEANVKAWAAAKMGEYGYSSVDDFLGQVADDLDLDRTIATKDGQEASWRDIDATRLFMKLRYSPLADKYFNMQTGPINLYILETGYSNFKTFMDTAFDNYDGLVQALNDALVAAVYDFFPQSENIGITNADGECENVVRPTLATTGNVKNKTTIATTLVNNTLKLFEYAANVTDQNILNPFYKAHNINPYSKDDNIISITSNLSEANFEEAMIPMLIACITQIDMLDPIHPETWDMAKDAEGVAYIALREYLSYVLPEKNYDQLVTTADGSFKAGVDLNGDKKLDLYTDVILFMARDAVGYLLNSIVPCRTKDGQEWNVYKSNLLTDKTTLFEILNSVICYYGSMDTFNDPKNGPTTGKGVAALLGVVDSNGNCAVKMSNSLWQNINAISNKLFPICGTMQYGTYATSGQSSSEEILYDTIIMGLLNIGEVNSHSGQRGITTILEQLITICTSEPVENKSILLLVYDDIVASLLNNLLGARAGVGYAQIVPYSSEYGANASTPFDSLVKESTLGEYGGRSGSFDGTGIIGVLISNIYQFFGGTGNNTLGNGCWQGAMFAVGAVNNFIPSFVPQLSEHSFNAATLSLDTPSEKVSSGTTRDAVAIKFTNNCRGLNRFYKDEDGNIQRSPRYFAKLKECQYSLADGSSISNVSIQLPNDKVVAPERTAKISLTGTNPVEGSQLIKFTAKYDLFEGEIDAQGNNPTAPANPLYEDLTASCYLYLTTENGWVEATFPTSQDGLMDPGDNVYDPDMFTEIDNTFMFNDVIISTADPTPVDSYGLVTQGIDGVMAKDDNGDAYASFDAKTGDLLNVGLVDYKIGKDGAWNRGTTTTSAGATVYTGYTENEIETVAANLQEGEEFATRTHVALTYDEAVTAGVVQNTVMDGSNYKQITVSTGLVVDGIVSGSLPTHGISFLNIDGASGTTKFMKYDGTTKIAADDYTVTVATYSNGSEGNEMDLHVILANDAEAVTLQNVYNDYIKEMASYQAKDFDDYNEAYGSSDTNDALQGAFQGAVETISMPITLENASTLVSTMETVANKNETTKTYGDVAFEPFTAAESTGADEALGIKTYVKNGYRYIDAACTLPLYKNVELSAAHVSAGKDPAGNAVVLSEDDNKYHVATATAYEYKWDVDTYAAPYYGKSNVQKTTKVDGEDVNVYLDTQYEYHMADGAKCDSGDPWTYKLAITSEKIKENDGTDYRGLYQQTIDNLTYNVEEAKKRIDTSLVSSVVDIIDALKGKNNVNYEVAAFEKMNKIANQATSLVYVVDQETVTDEDGKEVKKDVYSTTASSVEIREAVRQYNKYAALADAYARGYKGDKLEGEILCASGLAYTALTANLTKDADENITDASVTGPRSTAAKYGSYDATGKLVNVNADGEQAYTDESWNAYVTELAKAVDMATTKTAEISAIYTQKCDLAIAENNLTLPGDATSFRMEGQVVIANSATGATGVVGVKAGIYAGRALVGETNEDGTFSIAVDLGTTALTVKAKGAVKFADRAITVDGESNIADAKVVVNAFDQNNDGRVNSTDVMLYSNAAFDIDGNGAADKADGTIYKNALRSGVNFGSLVLE